MRLYYVARQLANQGDVLNAVTALLEHMKETLFQDGFRLGLPLQNFRQSLLWGSKVRYISHEHITKPSGSIPVTVRGSHFPSWTWTG
ncbi:hypothetical protein B0T14DRAFT_214809 [Immersiella caudata]|uniref:Uncharacterized protein n=1 Tax=Immersiella caudata TaxID=314043 RepID=A0AA39WQN0_9PEZI|nr:hypothetical protein B0T14DRAFT_214809 [Immersiella caudata]